MHYNTYFDEIKPDKNAGRNWYMIGGLVVPSQHVGNVEKRLNSLSKDIFGSEAPDVSNEFHCKNIWSGKKEFSGMSVSERINIFELLSVAFNEIIEKYEVGKVYSKVHKKLNISTSRKSSDIAFQYFCERVQKYLGKGSTSNLFGDFESRAVTADIVKKFNEFRQDGKTPWEYGIPLVGLVDGVSFHHSYVSRLIQLADVYLFFATFSETGRKDGYMFEKVKRIANKTKTGPNRYKEYPFQY